MDEDYLEKIGSILMSINAPALSHVISEADKINAVDAQNQELQNRNNELHAQNQELQYQNNQLQAKITALLNSKSWKITAPLRYGQNILTKCFIPLIKGRVLQKRRSRLHAQNNGCLSPRARRIYNDLVREMDKVKSTEKKSFED